MDDLINVFVTSNFTEETQEEIYQALGLFRVFNHLSPFESITERLMMESYTEASTTCDDITSIILVAQEYLLDRHGISLTDETTLAFNNIVLRVLFQLQKLEDATPVLKILETMENREYKLCAILELLTTTPITTFLQIVEEVRPICLETLSSFLYMQEDNTRIAGTVIPVIVEKVKLFKEVFGINPCVRVILDADIIMGEEFSLYRSIFDELREISTDENSLVETLLFLLLYSCDGNANPMATFDAHSDSLVADLSTAKRLSTTLGTMYMKLQRHKELVENEKA